MRCWSTHNSVFLLRFWQSAEQRSCIQKKKQPDSLFSKMQKNCNQGNVIAVVAAKRPVLHRP